METSICTRQFCSQRFQRCIAGCVRGLVRVTRGHFPTIDPIEYHQPGSKVRRLLEIVTQLAEVESRFGTPIMTIDAGVLKEDTHGFIQCIRFRGFIGPENVPWVFC